MLCRCFGMKRDYVTQMWLNGLTRNRNRIKDTSVILSEFHLEESNSFGSFKIWLKVWTSLFAYQKKNNIQTKLRASLENISKLSKYVVKIKFSFKIKMCLSILRIFFKKKLFHFLPSLMKFILATVQGMLIMQFCWFFYYLSNLQKASHSICKFQPTLYDCAKSYL